MSDQVNKSKQDNSESDDEDEAAQNRSDSIGSLEQSFGISIQILDTPPPIQSGHQSMEPPSLSMSFKRSHAPLQVWSFSDDKKALKIRENHRSACTMFDEASLGKEVGFEEFVQIFRKNGFDGSIHENENEILKYPEARKRLIEVLKKAIKLSEAELPGTLGVVVQLIMADGFKTTGCLAAHLEGIEDANAEAEKFIDNVKVHQVPKREPLQLFAKCEQFLLKKLSEIDMKSAKSIKLFPPLLRLANTGLCAVNACEVLSAMELDAALDMTFAPIYDCAMTLLSGGDIEECLGEMIVQLNRWASIWLSVVPGLMDFGNAQKVCILANEQREMLVEFLKKQSKKKQQAPLVMVRLIQLTQQGYRGEEVALYLGANPTVSFVGKSVTKPDKESGTAQNFIVEKEDLPDPSVQSFTADGVQIMFALDMAPSPATIHVTVNGMVVKDWKPGEDHEGNFAVVFAAPPESGADIVITYMTQSAGQRRVLYLRPV